MIEKTISRLRDGHAVLASPTRVNGAYVFEALALGAIGMSILTLGMLALDDRTLAGEPVWLKPIKFSVSFAVLFATLGFAAGRLSSMWRHSRLIVATAGASAAAFLLEITDIAAQVARQEASHVNDSLPLHAATHAPIGHGATVLMAVIAVVGIVVWSDRAARLAPGLRLGLGLGFLLTSILTIWVAGELSGNGGPFVGVPGDVHARLPLLGWSMETGDLRPAHFLALHAMQVLPLAGHLADRNGASTRSVWMAAALYAILTAIVFHQALLGIPLISA
jgi:hypothetical protein